MVRGLVALLALTPLIVGLAPLANAQAYAPSTNELSLVDQTCTKVMGLKPGETYFARCHESLFESLEAQNEGQAMSAAYASCRGRGFGSATASLSTCMLDASKTEPHGVGSLTVALTGNNINEAGKSFFEVPPSVRFERERYACAQLGILPDTMAFGRCVASLDTQWLPDPN